MKIGEGGPGKLVRMGDWKSAFTCAFVDGKV
jgi:hypothetical protein